MTAPTPKSREEWVRAMDEIIWQYEHGGFGNWMKSRDAAIDSIMALQSEVALVTALEKQIDRLAKFIMAEIPGEPSQSEGAVDTAIRLLKARQPK